MPDEQIPGVEPVEPPETGPLSTSPFSTIAAPGQNPAFVGVPDFSDPPHGGGFLGVSIQQSGSSQALIAKMTEKHVGDVIASDSADRMWRNYLEALKSILAVFTFLIFLAGMILLCVIFLIYNKPEYLQGILGALFGMIGGGGVGFSLGRVTSAAPAKKNPAD